MECYDQGEIELEKKIRKALRIVMHKYIIYYVADLQRDNGHLATNKATDGTTSVQKPG